jgi:threonine/homoserine/homoserine lactone efflux protein
MLAAITGLAALLHASAVAFEVIKYLGVAYLLYMAWSMWRDHESFAGADEAAPRSDRRVIVDAVAINILNPKLTIFFFAFLPQFVHAGDPNVVASMLGLSAVFMIVTFAVFALYGVFAAAVRQHVVARPRIVTWIRRSFAATFVALGARPARRPARPARRRLAPRDGASPRATAPRPARRRFAAFHLVLPGMLGKPSGLRRPPAGPFRA